MRKGKVWTAPPWRADCCRGTWDAMAGPRLRPASLIAPPPGDHYVGQRLAAALSRAASKREQGAGLGSTVLAADPGGPLHPGASGRRGGSLAADEHVVEVLERAVAPSSPGGVLDAWAYAHGVELRFIEPGKPIQNAFIESFNGSLRGECLNQHWFHDLPGARRTIELWRHDYNAVRPHSSPEPHPGRVRDVPQTFKPVGGCGRMNRPTLGGSSGPGQVHVKVQAHH